MSIAQFSLVKKVPVTILRHAAGSYVEGEWTEGAETSVGIQANVQPFSDYQVSIMPESDRTKSWVWLFTSSEVRQKKEGTSGYGGDRFVWEGDLYEVMKVQTYTMTVQDHRECKCARIELTPN
jgi:hypothetical protein